jgi:hypothetical protein
MENENSTQSKGLIKYRLREIITRRHSFYGITNSANDTDELVKISINHKIIPTVNYNIKDDLILITIFVEAFRKETQEVVLDIETVFVFHAVDLKNYIAPQDEKTNKYKFINDKDEALITLLIGISLSTMRGIVHEKSRGTIIENIPIPILNPASFIKK